MKLALLNIKCTGNLTVCVCVCVCVCLDLWVRRAGHVARMGERRELYQYKVGNLEGKKHFGDPVVSGGIILKLIFRKWDVGVWRVRAGSG